MCCRGVGPSWGSARPGTNGSTGDSGVPFPPLAERFERLEEALQICLQMWSDDDGPYEGRHYQLAETICSPRPIQRPRPPILIGGSGEQKTLRLVARYADACNLFAPDPAVVAHKLEVLDRHCDAESRDPAGIERTIIYGDPIRSRTSTASSPPWTSTPRWASRQVWLSPPGPDPAAWVARVGEHVVPELAQL